jgi:Ran GTPase-activating protein (RanGAP) involved in mRNA processing and transport
MVADPKILDIRGQSLKLNTAADVTPLLEGYDPTLVEEVHLGGNTIGIEAAQEFARFLEKTRTLKVFLSLVHLLLFKPLIMSRSQTLLISSPVDSSPRSQMPSRLSAMQ